MIDKNHCSGCRNNYYNNERGSCWSLVKAKMVWRIRIGNFENPPYLNKTKVHVPDCYHTESCGDHFIKPEALTKEGYWK